MKKMYGIRSVLSCLVTVLAVSGALSIANANPMVKGLVGNWTGTAKMSRTDGQTICGETEVTANLNWQVTKLAENSIRLVTIAKCPNGTEIVKGSYGPITFEPGEAKVVSLMRIHQLGNYSLTGANGLSFNLESNVLNILTVSASISIMPDAKNASFKMRFKNVNKPEFDAEGALQKQ